MQVTDSMFMGKMTDIMSSINQKLLSHHVNIKPCPFCGSDRIYVGIDSAEADGYHVKCVKCGCKTPQVYPESLDNSGVSFEQTAPYCEAQVGFKCCQKALSVWNRRYS